MDEAAKERAREATRRWRAKNRGAVNAKAREDQKRWRAENPEIHRQRAKDWKARNKDRFDARHKKWRDENREHLNKQGRAAYYRHKYGITIAERDTMLEAQGGVCKICRRIEHAKRGWAVDHCHKTGAVRGVLCQSCNLVLGYAADDTTILRSMITYLEISKCP